jgi:hypothetical protein
MKHRSKYNLASTLISTMIAVGLLGGCGLYVPEIEEVGQTPTDAEILVNDIVTQVHCELRQSVQELITEDIESAKIVINGHPQGRMLEWLESWSAQVTLTLQIDEVTAFNPGLSLNTPIIPATTTFPGSIAVITPQSYTLGFGGVFSSHATRIEKLNFFYAFRDFFRDGVNRSRTCEHRSNILIKSDLKINQWMTDATFPYTTHSIDQAEIPDPGDGGPLNVISHEITFVIVTGANVTPTWNLIRISANTGSLPFLDATRTRSHDLLITIGPTKKKQPAPEAQNAHLASQIGLAVAQSIRAQQ